MFILSQVLGLFGFALVVVAMALKSRSKLLLLKLCSTIFILMGYFFVGSYAGVLVAAVSLVRGILAFWFVYNNSKTLKRVCIGLLSIGTVLLHAVFWQSWLSVLAAAISLIAIGCFFQTKVFYIRFFSVITSVLEIILNVAVFNPVNIAIELFTISSCVFGMVQNDVVVWRIQKDTKRRCRSSHSKKENHIKKATPRHVAE